MLLKPLLLAWRGLRFVARWWLVWLVALVLFLANVPGEGLHELEYLGNGSSSNLYYYHGWPCAFLERRAVSWAQPKPTDNCWQIRTGVLRFSGWILLGDLIIAASLLVATAFAMARLRRLFRPRFSLRGALIGLAVVSLLMAWSAKWRSEHLEMAEIAKSLSRGGVYGPLDCPTWMLEMLPVPPPLWLVELGVGTPHEPLPSAPEDAARLQRALELRPHCLQLILDNETFPKSWRQFVSQVSTCENLEIDFFIERPATITSLVPLMRSFGNLRKLDIFLGEGDIWPGGEVLVAIPRSGIRSLVLYDACATFDDLATIAQCRQLETLHLSAFCVDSEPLISTSGLRQLQSLVNLKNLVLRGNTIQIADSTSFGSFEKLRFLTLSGVVNDGWSVADLEPLKQLVGLDLSDTPITLADVQTALRLPRLQILWIPNCGVDPAEIQQLQKAHPRVQITF